MKISTLKALKEEAAAAAAALIIILNRCERLI
jgi:hypothetical protein